MKINGSGIEPKLLSQSATQEKCLKTISIILRVVILSCPTQCNSPNHLLLTLREISLFKIRCQMDWVETGWSLD